MSQYSLPWNSSGTGHGPAAGYTAADWRRMQRGAFGEGVFRRTSGEFADQFTCTSAANQITVKAGSACVDGFMCLNDAATTLPVPSPASTTAGAVVLRVDWTSQTAVVATKMAATGNTTPPAATQTDATLWEMILYTFVITSGGAITLTDARQYIAFSNPASITLGKRKGASATDPTSPGATSYSWNGLKMQFGVAQANFASGDTHFYSTVTFDEAFVKKPFVFIQVATEISTGDGPIAGTVDRGDITLTTFKVHMQRDAAYTAALNNIAFFWFAFGDAA